MKSDDWVERLVTARLAEHDERVRLRRAGKAARGAKRDAVKLARQRAAEERARLRELRNALLKARWALSHASALPDAKSKWEGLWAFVRQRSARRDLSFT